jgi:hypothetical protein
MGKNTNGDKPATRTDLVELRTELKSDIARLDKKIDSVAVGLVMTQSELREMKEGMVTKSDLRAATTPILKAVEGLSERIVGYEYRTAVRTDKFMAQKRKLADHERRISSLEKQP